jgi:tripartite-type tricarboxylate transporter receptor subunit TctC
MRKSTLRADLTSGKPVIVPREGPMMNFRRALNPVAAFLAVLLATTLSGRADTYPSRAVKLIVPYQAGGGGLDALARMVAQKLSERSRAPYYVENIPGAGGTIGTGAAVHAVADGHTLLFMNQDFVVQPLLKAKVPYDPFKDFAPVTMTAAGTEAIIVNPSVDARNMAELIALLKTNPGKYSYASPGHGTSPHLASERLFKMTYGLDVVHVPFQGGAPAVAATLAGHTNILHINLAVVAPYLKDGRLRVLAVASKTRAAAFPDVPTLEEAGIPGHEVGYWNGVVAPAGTPRNLVEQVSRRISEVLALPDVKEKLEAAGFEPIGSAPEVFAAHIAAESAEWAKIVRAARIKID